jgi:hypothetical protein
VFCYILTVKNLVYVLCINFYTLSNLKHPVYHDARSSDCQKQVTNYSVTGCDDGCLLTSVTRSKIQIFFVCFIVSLNRSLFFAYGKCQSTDQKDDTANLRKRAMWLETLYSAQILRKLFAFGVSRIFIYVGLGDL